MVVSLSRVQEMAKTEQSSTYTTRPPLTPFFFALVGRGYENDRLDYIIFSIEIKATRDLIYLMSLVWAD